MNWFLSTGHKFWGFVITAIQLIVHWEDLMDRFSGWMGLKKIYERRHGVIKYLKLIPVLEKLATDLEAAAKSPEDQAVAADVRTLIADISTGS
jgi:hypothetical protein